jgi:dephospho-CoA kinase
VTGDVGSGKTAVLSWLAAHGAATLDADSVVRRLLDCDPAVGRAIVDRFGTAVRESSGSADRGALAAIVFADGVALRDLERILHPRVLEEVRAWLAAVPGDVAVAAVEAVKLVESGLGDAMDAVWLVVCDRAERRRRLAARGWSPSEIEERLAASPPLAGKLGRVAAVIDNSGSEAATVVQLELAWRHLAG